MDLVAVNGNVDLTECVSPENPASPEACDNSGIYGEPEILPRVGDEYQVQIPSLISFSDYLKLSPDPIHSEITSAISIPVVWIRDEPENGNESSTPQHVENKSLVLAENGSSPKVHPIDVTVASSNVAESRELGSSVLPQCHEGKGHRLVPGGFEKMWTDVEESGFLLGLYIFGKNLVAVKRLVGMKQMGDVLSYYYGRFYRSDKYRRWSECRKTRTRRCIYGQRIFMGSRHQEFLSRLLLNESEESRFAVLEMSKAFGEGKTQLEEYVLGLKAKLGLSALVEAVGVGKGKRDLTGIVSDTPKTNHAVHLRPEIPTGKACSSLTPREIISFLTGDFRLSKAKSNDIFWEAVWPRLLARGWHSEQPNATANPKNSLVFLVPGIKKFSRRKLVKGDHYYDSVTDVLSLVASDPSLLEIDALKSKEESNGWTEEPKLEHQEAFPNEQRHCYLKPRTPSRSSDALTFTVVDTSRAGGKARKVRELRTLPFEGLNAFTFLSPSDDSDNETDIDTSKASPRPSLLDENKTNGFKPGMIDFGGKISGYDGSNLGFEFNGGALIALPAIHAGSANGTAQKKGAKTKPEKDKNHSAPAKRRRKKSPARPEPAQPRSLIDLNEPAAQIIETVEVSEPSTAERPDREISKEPENWAVVKTEPEASVVPLRQSRRNRPLTTKVLEAFACGFMDTKHKRKAKDETSKPAKRTRPKPGPPEGVDPVPRVDLPTEESQTSNNDGVNNLGVSSQTG